MKRSWVTAFVTALAAAAPGAGAGAQPAEIGRLAWLAGCWKVDGAEAGTIEQWMPLSGETLLGMARTVKQGRTVAHEFMQIRQGADGKLAFHAQPSGKPADTFPLLRLTDSEAVFENLQHEFPQRVIYRHAGDGKLDARIEGMRNGVLRAIPYPMTRASCDALVQEAAKP